MNDIPVRVKICGLTTEGDAREAIRLGAAALGFNGWPGSKRYLDLAQASAWIATLPPLVMRVAVLVNPSIEEAERVATIPGINALQFHGDETPEFCAHFLERGVACIKAFRLPLSPDAIAPERYPHMPFLVDASVPGEYGGTGSPIDAELAARFVQEHPQRSVLLSGGINPGNAASMAERVRPYAIDLASGVESAPGVKDFAKMKNLFAALKTL